MCDFISCIPKIHIIYCQYCQLFVYFIESLVSTDELADQMSQALTTQLNSLAPASQSAFQLCAPLQTNSPSVPGSVQLFVDK